MASSTDPTREERPGFKRVISGGRAYPTPEAAVAALRAALAKDGITVPDSDIMPRLWTNKAVICPWEAVAWIPDNKK